MYQNRKLREAKLEPDSAPSLTFIAV